MELNKAQRDEVRDYIITVPKYRETYHELYDHLLNALAEREETFSIEEVIKIINDDFGGFSEIVQQEKEYQREIVKKYNVVFRQQMLNTFRWPELLNNLIILSFCLFLYYAAEKAMVNARLIFFASLICCLSVTVFGLFKIFSNRLKYARYSVLDNFLAYSCTFGLSMGNAVLQLVMNTGLFDVSSRTKIITTLLLFFFCSIYVRAFIKFYNQKFYILTLS